MVGLYGIATLLFANNTLLLPAMFALTFRKLLLRVWKMGVDLLCSAFFAVAGVASACLFWGLVTAYVMLLPIFWYTRLRGGRWKGRVVG